MPAKVAVIIPARWGSTRFPGKSLHPIAGKPLVQHVWERCGKARGIEEVIIATDDMRIAEAAFGFGANVALTSAKHQSGTDRIAEVAKRLRGYSHVINVQGDEPLIDPTLITRLARALAKEKQIGMITAANPFTAEEELANPNSVKVVVDRNGDALYFSRSAVPFLAAAARSRSICAPGYLRLQREVPRAVRPLAAEHARESRAAGAAPGAGERREDPRAGDEERLDRRGHSGRRASRRAAPEEELEPAQEVRHAS
jgi:3-deoxy-D-manno-octulosonate cytidylyltransferase